MKKICIITATRAEYGLLKPVMNEIRRREELELQIIVTGAHLSPEFGLTYREIENDGFTITDKVEMLLSSDTCVGITKSMAVELMGMADAYRSCCPDMVVVLGDRYEILIAAIAAMIARIPIAHIHGGEITEGAYDDAIRHAITKMSQLHFTSTEEYRNRVIQMGELPDKVYNVGALGVENTKKISLLSRSELEQSMNFSFDLDTIIVTYHPVTLEDIPSKRQFQNLLNVLEKHKELKVIFTKANADTDGRIINEMIDTYVRRNSKQCVAYTSLGQVRYLSSLQFCRAVVGNSSSGIIEAPSFHVPTVDIGDRQRGRIAAKTVIHCGYEAEEIDRALKKALSKEFYNMAQQSLNPYEGVDTSRIIVNKISENLLKSLNIRKKFYDILVR